MRLHALLISALLMAPALADGIKVENAWIREPAPGQTVVGGFMDITSEKNASVVKAASPAIGTVELHEMKMLGDVMQMREIKAIELPAGKTVKLEPGGLHLMLYNPKKPLKAGDRVPLTLTVQSGEKLEEVTATAEVRAMSMRAPAPHSMH
ncbi:MAG: copper chaperone PCu(A)C [Pseudomonadota bacterium]